MHSHTHTDTNVCIYMVEMVRPLIMSDAQQCLGFGDSHSVESATVIHSQKELLHLLKIRRKKELERLQSSPSELDAIAWKLDVVYVVDSHFSSSGTNKGLFVSEEGETCSPS